MERLGAGLGMFGDSGTVDIMQLKGCLTAAGCSTLTYGKPRSFRTHFLHFLNGMLRAPMHVWDFLLCGGRVLRTNAAINRSSQWFGARTAAGTSLHPYICDRPFVHTVIYA